MASIISAGTSTGTALNLTGDTSGILQLASNNGTVGLTLDTSQNLTYVGALTGGTGVVNLGSGQFYKDASGNVGIGTNSPASYGKFVVSSGAVAQDIVYINSYSQLHNTLGGAGLGGAYTQWYTDNTPTFASAIGTTVPGGAATTALLFSTYSGAWVERMRIASGGNISAGGQFSAGAVKAIGSSAGGFEAGSWFVQYEGTNIIRSYSCGPDTSTYGTWTHYSAKSNGTPLSVFTASNGSFAVSGALSKGSGSFRIDHPLPELEETHQLVHSFIEGPQADLIYRGRVSLVNGKATVNIDEAATMTEGTFVVLCRDVQCFTTNESDWTPVRGSVSGNILTIESQDDKATSNISWMVIGERQDKHMMETNWTDKNGKVIVEPLKEIEPPIMAGVNTETEGAK